jgi:hypothetical protein
MAQARPEDIEYVSRLKFASVFQYVTSHSREDVASDNYFHCISQRYLVTGDEIQVVCMAEDKSWSKAVFEVVSADTHNTLVEQVVPWRTGGPKKKSRGKPKAVASEKVA